MRDFVKGTSEWYIARLVHAWGLAAFDQGWDVLELSQVGEPKNGLLSCNGVLTPDWSRIEITRKLVASYGKLGRGIRMGRQRDGGVVGAFSADVPDGRASNAFAFALCDELGERIDAAPHCVNSKYGKSCFLFQLEDELEHTWRSRQYDMNGVEVRVEVFGSPKSQVGFMGVHSRDDQTLAPADFYLNEFGPDPATHAPADTPLVTKAELERVWQRIQDGWTELGFQKHDAERAQRREFRGSRATRYRRNVA